MFVKWEKWQYRKKLAWSKIWEDLEIGYLDRDLLPLLILINRDRNFYTTSSCSGRILLMDSKYPWSRDETGIVFKSHVPIRDSELDFVFSLEPYVNFWLSVTGPIIHLYASSPKKAIWLLNLARRQGFKHSGIMYVSRSKGVFVELITGIYLSQTIKLRNKIIISQAELRELIKLVNTVLVEGKKRLHRLYLELAEKLPETIDEEVERDLSTRKSITNKSPLDIFKEICEEKGTLCEVD